MLTALALRARSDLPVPREMPRASRAWTPRCLAQPSLTAPSLVLAQGSGDGFCPVAPPTGGDTGLFLRPAGDFLYGTNERNHYGMIKPR